MEVLKIINSVITILFFLFYAYQFFFIPVSWFAKKKKSEIPIIENRIAVLICARNESLVIGNLIDSIHEQTYDQKLIDIFVIADNCTDDTAEIAEEHGAHVYIRNNTEQIGKGYAMRELRAHITEDYPDGFDAYLVFDADNTLSPEYIREMNIKLCEGNDIITSYRNSSNFSANWISAGYALWFLRESRYLNYPRYLLGTSCAVSGTGFMFSRKVAEEIVDWPFHMLTEDIEFSINRILNGYKIAYCENGEFFDEQPTSFRQSWRQRMRWAKGYIQVFRGYGVKLIKGIFGGSFAAFDMSSVIMPAFILTGLSVLCNIALAVWGTIETGSVLTGLYYIGQLLMGLYTTLFVIGIITTITEWKKINASAARKILSVITFPVFIFTYMPIAVSALFCKVEWKPIVHYGSDKEKGCVKENIVK